MEIYYAVGPEVVRYLKSLGHSVFLDLKLHDIPNTVKSTMKILSNLGVDMTNVQAAAEEGRKLGEAYTEDLKQKKHTFRIPVYQDMPESAAAQPN